MFAFMLPMRPGKLRLVVETTTSRSLVRPSWAPKQGPQPGLRTVAPASRMILHQPLASISSSTSWDAGTMRVLTSGWTFLPLKALATCSISLIRPLVQEPTTTWVTGVPATSFTGTTLAGQKGFAIWGSSLERSTSRTSAVSLSLSAVPKSVIMLPISMPMLHTVMRSATENSSMPGPVKRSALSTR